MEMKKLHMGTVSYGYDSMDEVAHQLAVAFGANIEQGWTSCFNADGVIGSKIITGYNKTGSITTGAQLATRGRRDMSSRVHDVVLSLALCHNVRSAKKIFTVSICDLKSSFFRSLPLRTTMVLSHTRLPRPTRLLL